MMQDEETSRGVEGQPTALGWSGSTASNNEAIR